MIPRFSVIIATYGRQAFLAEALESVLAQTVQDFEVIVVDDASPEPARVPRHPAVRLVRSSVNRGPAASRNRGVDASVGEVLTFLDDDDEWTPDRLSLAESGLSRAPIAVCWQSPRSGRVLEGDVHDVILDSTTPSQGATALLRGAWLPMDESYRAGEDLLWWLDLTARRRVATVQRQGLIVRCHDDPRIGYGSDARIAASHRLMADRWQYFDAHPAAAAYRWKRIGLMEEKMGNYGAARRAHWRAFRTRPTFAAAKHLGRSLARS